jgi:hypothetical protein
MLDGELTKAYGSQTHATFVFAPKDTWIFMTSIFTGPSDSMECRTKWKSSRAPGLPANNCSSVQALVSSWQFSGRLEENYDKALQCDNHP